jgi:hypothetical protein
LGRCQFLGINFLPSPVRKYKFLPTSTSRGIYSPRAIFPLFPPFCTCYSICLPISFCPSLFLFTFSNFPTFSCGFGYYFPLSPCGSGAGGGDIFQYIGPLVEKSEGSRSKVVISTFFADSTDTNYFSSVDIPYLFHLCNNFECSLFTQLNS